MRGRAKYIGSSRCEGRLRTKKKSTRTIGNERALSYKKVREELVGSLTPYHTGGAAPPGHTAPSEGNSREITKQGREIDPPLCSHELTKLFAIVRG